jgi:hypothetical protein
VVISLTAVCGNAQTIDLATMTIPFNISVPLVPHQRYTFRFSLFDSGILGEGNELWREYRTYRVPSSKVITHQLGSVVPFGRVPVHFNEQLWVEVSVRARSFTRRVKLQVVPYANYSPTLYGFEVKPDDVSPSNIRGNPDTNVADGVIGATILGDPHTVLGNYGVISGGTRNQAGADAVVVGGDDNLALGDFSVVVGAGDNDATGTESSMIGGCGCRAMGDGSTVIGGCSNKTPGYRSFAAGEDAKASRRGMFVWSATDDYDPDGGSDRHYNRVYEGRGGFPQETLGDPPVPNPLFKDMQFWVKSPGGVFFVTGQDDAIPPNPLGVMLSMGSQVWEPITPTPVWAANAGSQHDAAAAAPAPVSSLYARALDLSKRAAAQRNELESGLAESMALESRLAELVRREAELRSLLAGEPRGGSDLAGTGRGDGQP